ncbi:MAG TPA: PIG-L family deacetylase [Methylomirabilota bacterium]|jgi:LmbE family N-acetylglucosaminyl deacetylase
MVVVSPHLDDAVLGCSAVLAAHPGAVVVTVFAGRPAPASRLPPWDAAAGFRAGDDVVGARRDEDRAALRLLRAVPVWLPFLDAQYEHSPGVDAVVAALEAALTALRTSAVCVPLGLFHSDHVLTHAAALHVLRRHPTWRWLAYEEPMYRRVPGAVVERLASLATAGIRAIACGSLSPPPLKREAMECYASQLRALASSGRPGITDALAPERYWTLAA